MLFPSCIWVYISDVTASGPLFLQLAEDIKEQIASGSLHVGAYLPSVRKLQEHHGVSKNTVLSALRTLQEEQIIAREGASRYGFRIVGKPTSRAGGRVSAGAGIAKFILPFSYWNYTGSKLLEAIEASFGAENIGLLFGNHQNDTARERVLLKRIVEHHRETLETLILMTASSYSSRNTDLVQTLAQSMPVLLLDRRVLGVESHLVAINNRKVGQIAADLFVERGAKTIGFVTAFWDASSIRDRFGGFRDRLEERGFELDSRHVVQIAKGYEAVDDLARAWDLIESELKQMPVLPDALFCGSDKAAGAVLRHCADRGIKVPGDVALVGCDFDQCVNSRVGRTITSFAYPYGEVSSELVRLYVEFRGSRNATFRAVELDPEFIPGDTT